MDALAWHTRSEDFTHCGPPSEQGATRPDLEWQPHELLLIKGLLNAMPSPAILVNPRGAVPIANERAIEYLAKQACSVELWVKRSPWESNPNDFEVKTVQISESTPWLLILFSEVEPRKTRFEELTVRWGLTSRQKEVLSYLVKGYSNAAIALHLGVKENTIEVHISAIFIKAKCHSRVDLVSTVLS